MKRRIIKISVFLAVAVLAILIVVNRRFSVTELEHEIIQAKTDGKIPAVMLCPMTGDYDYVGEMAAWSAQYAADQINANGGLNGRPIQLIIENTDSDPGQAKSIADKVKGQVLFLIGPVTSPEISAVTDDIMDNKILDIGTYSFDDALLASAPYGVSYMSNSDRGEWECVQRWLNENPDMERVVIFTDSRDTSKWETAQEMVKNLSQLGVTVAGTVDISGETSEQKYMKCAIQALNMKADGYISLLSAQDYANILIQLRLRGVEEGRRITGSFSAFTEELIQSAGDSLDGTYIWNKFNPEYDSDEWNALVEAYRRDHDGNLPLSTTVVDIYDSVMALKVCFDTLDISGEDSVYDQEAEAIVRWFYNSDEIQGIQGSYRWENGEKIKDYEYFVFDGTHPVSIE